MTIVFTSGFETGLPVIRAAQRRMIVVDDRVVDAVIGYRSWLYQLYFGVVSLRGPYRQEPWPPGVVMTAQCVLDTGSKMYPLHRGAPVLGCTCGLYAYGWSGHTELVSVDTTLVGEVSLWGSVVIHEQGYRAEHARIEALHVLLHYTDKQRFVVDLAAEQYAVPLVRESGESTLFRMSADADVAF